MLNWFREPAPSRSPGTVRPLSARLAVEQLETRTVPSAATVTIARGIILSPENFQNFVTQEYLNFLRRPPDPLGLANFVFQLQRGLSPELVDAAFVGSNEYVADHGGNPTGFVLGLYNDILGRAPNIAEVNFWVTQLTFNGATTGQVALAFTTSQEREANVIAKDYLRFLGRVVDPGGLVNWLNQIRLFGGNQETVDIGIVSSNEFFQKHGSNNRDFIIGVYQTVLNRTPGTSEINFWLNLVGG
jgi:hypothetical protein